MIATNGILLNKYMDLLAANNIQVRLEANNFINNVNTWPNIYKLVDKDLLTFSILKFCNGRKIENNNVHDKYVAIKSILGKSFTNRCYMEIDINNPDRTDFDFSDFIIESLLVNIDSNQLINTRGLNQAITLPLPIVRELVTDLDGRVRWSHDYSYPIDAYIDEMEFTTACLLNGHYMFAECFSCIIRNLCKFKGNNTAECTRKKYNAASMFLQLMNKECMKVIGNGIYVPTNGDTFFNLPELEFSKLHDAILRNQ